MLHELVSTDIHVDICVVPPSKERDYYTLVTMGMGAHRMNVPAELAEYKLERAELVIALPKDWKLKHEDQKNERCAAILTDTWRPFKKRICRWMRLPPITTWPYWPRH